MRNKREREREQEFTTIELKEDLTEDEDVIVVEIMVNIDYTYDSNYGADLDGNRGIGVWFVDEYEYEIRECSKEGELTEKQQEELDQKVYKFVMNF